MRTPDAIARLDFHQERVRATLTRALDCLKLAPALAQAELARERWIAARQLREYQVFKQTEIFRPAIRFGGCVHAQRAAELSALCEAAGQRFQAHLQYWASRDVAAEWDHYKPAMMAMAAEMRRTLSVERANVVALLAGTERTRQRRA